MSKASRIKREMKKLEEAGIDSTQLTDIREYKQRKEKKVRPIGHNQERFWAALKNLDDVMVVGAGSAGTGKTMLATYAAAELYNQNHVSTIILTRPTVECGEKLGHLPGKLEEKYEPYLEPFEDYLKEKLGANKFKNDLNKNILPNPIQFMRGKTFHNTIILIDEAQNIKIDQMKMILTRVGEGSKIVFTGDTKQDDLRDKENGLSWLIRQIKHQQTRDELIEFTDEDCQRSEFCKRMLKMIENEV